MTAREGGRGHVGTRREWRAAGQSWAVDPGQAAASARSVLRQGVVLGHWTVMGLLAAQRVELVQNGVELLFDAGNAFVKRVIAGH